MTMEFLPVELSSSIFEWVVHGDATSQDSTPRQHYKRALGLTQINRHLRNVAFTCPSLWTSVFVTKEHPLHLPHASLRRSGACPLTVLVDVNHMPLDHVSPILLDLPSHFSRWETFKLVALKLESGVEAAVVQALDNAFRREEAKSMTSLELIAPSDPQLRSRWQTIAPINAPRLKSLCLTNTGFEWAESHLPSLDRLELGGVTIPSLDSFIHILRTASHLQTIKLSKITVASGLEADGAELPLLHLKTLQMDDVSLTFIHHVLHSLNTPVLQKLWLGPNGAPENLFWGPIPALRQVKVFAWHSSCDASSEGEMLRAGAAFRGIVDQLRTTREVRCSSVYAIGQLSEMSEDGVLPNLKRLECLGMKGSSVTLLVSLVEDRMTYGLPRLDELSISARDFSVTASVGRKTLEELDVAMDKLRLGTGKLEVREKQDSYPIRFTFLGWRDYQTHQSRGRRAEYAQEYEE